MDSNGTRFHLIYGAADWGACLAQPEGSLPLRTLWLSPADPSPLGGEDHPPAWDPARCELTLPARISPFDRSPQDSLLRLSDRRGAAGDVFGSLFWIDTNEQDILVRSAGSGKVSLFWASASQAQPGDAAQELTLARGSFIQREPDAPRPLHLRGLTVTRDHFLIAGVLDPPGLLVFDLHGGGAPQQMRWPASPDGVEPFTPFDMAARPDGGVWILDRRLEAPPLARLWALDRRLNVISLKPPQPLPAPAPDFRPLAGESPLPGRSCPPQLVLSYDSPVILREGNPLLVGRLTAVEALPDQSALVLDNPDPAENWSFARLLRYSAAGKLLADTLTTAVLREKVDPDLANFSLAGHDFVFLPGSQAAANTTAGACCGLEDTPASPVEAHGSWGTLLVVQQEGNQAYAFSVYPAGSPVSGEYTPLALQAEAVYLPMRLFAGRGLVAGLALSSDTGTGITSRAYYDSGRDPVIWVPLVEQKRPRYTAAADLFTPLLPAGAAGDDLRHAFDGGFPNCTWHRLMVDGCLPSGSRLEVWSRAANTEADLELSPWHAEPSPYRRGDGSELPFLREPAASAGDGTWELLFQSARGRYLQLWLRLSGDGRSTPRLRAMRVYYPRFSYLEQYLPAVFRQDAQSADFLDRFLANIEGMYTALEDRIASVQVLFDERTIPAEYLDWLNSWFGLVFDPSWDETRKRLFLAHAFELFSLRGTPLGLVRMVRLATDPCPSEKIFSETLEYTPGKRPSPVRIVESFRTRAAPGVVFGDPTQPEAPGFVLAAPDEPWTPALGAASLHARYQDYLKNTYTSPAALQAAWNRPITAFEQVRISPLPPANPAEAADWQKFLRDVLPFPYAAVSTETAPGAAADLDLFRAFLARRYGYIEALKNTYQDESSQAYTRFEDIPLPTILPEIGPALFDWIEFISIVVPTHRTAHHFTVLVPTLTAAQTDQGSVMVERVARIVALEKPAHTTFTVKEYWALFRVGEARLGFDTQIDVGSRLAPVVLDASYLAQGYLSFAHPWSATNRIVLGRDPLGASPRPQV